ncbi:hypothetical protein [Mycobacterium sp.]|uniref:hypothetical protein n=1 Tax=Mycobacterium sp. TaxID=1785 RepID=UPI0031DF4005
MVLRAGVTIVTRKLQRATSTAPPHPSWGCRPYRPAGRRRGGMTVYEQALADKASF